MEDVSCLGLACMSAAPLDAPFTVRNAAKYACQTAAGHGALREFIEHILPMKNGAISQKNEVLKEGSAPCICCVLPS